MKRILKRVAISVGILASLFIILAAITIVYYLICPGPWGCSNEKGAEGAVAAELDTMQTAVDAMMADNELTQVRASTSGFGGEKIDATSTQFHDTIILRKYMKIAATTFCYRWDTDGRITFQYDVNSDGNCAIDARQLFP